MNAIECRQNTYRQRGLWRTVRTHLPSSPPYIRLGDQTLLNGSSNDYLGLATHPKVIKACTEAATAYGVGGQASPMVAGHTTLHQALEEKLAEHYSQDKALLFASGYQANSAMIQGLIAPTDRVLHDKRNHASLVRTLSTGFAHQQRYRHRDYDHLTTLLSTPHTTNSTWLVSDTVFSMSGQQADLDKLNTLAGEHDAHLLLDNTHGIGIIDPLQNHPLMHAGVISTGFGKALGCQGGALIGSKHLIEAIEQWGPSYMFSTALAPPLVGAVLASLDVLDHEPEHLATLQDHITHFTTLSQAAGLPLIPSNTPIQIIEAPDVDTAIDWSQQLEHQGFFIHPIRPPALPGKQACLRLLLNRHFTKTHIEAWVDALVALQNTVS